jgi:hypothetical protein
MKRRLDNSLHIPGDVVWSVEDWRDFYTTLKRFKARLMKRHGLENRKRRPSRLRGRRSHTKKG